MLPARRPGVGRMNPDIAKRPGLVQGDSQILFEGMGRLLNENSFINIKTSRTPSPRSSSSRPTAASGA